MELPSDKCDVCGLPLPADARVTQRRHLGACRVAYDRAQRAASRSTAPKPRGRQTPRVRDCDVCAEPMPEDAHWHRRRHEGECSAEHDRRRIAKGRKENRYAPR